MGKRTSAIVLLLLSCRAAGCTRAPDSPVRSESSDSAGWTVVHSGSPVWDEGQGWTVPPEPELVIGVVSGPEEYQLVEVADAGRLSDGSVVVVDRGAQAVRLYGPDGRFRVALGGPGAGPGEFNDPVSVMVTQGDTMVVWDRALLRTTRFTPRGDLAEVHTVDWGKLALGLGVEMASKGGEAGGKNTGVPSGLYPGPMEPLADGGFLVRLVGKDGAPPGATRYRPPAGALRVSGDLSVMDTLMFFGDTEQVVVDAPWGPFSVTPPGALGTRTAVSGSSPRICIGDQEAPQVFCFGPRGEKTLLRWDADPLPLTRDEVSAWREETLRLLDPKLDRDQVLEVLDQVPVLPFRPPYSRIFLDPAGDLWVERGPGVEGVWKEVGGHGAPTNEGAENGGPGDSRGYLVFDPEGHLLGTVPLPPVRILEIGLDYVLGVYQDELEIQYLHVHRLLKP